jgi:hypothetical protein
VREERGTRCVRACACACAFDTCNTGLKYREPSPGRVCGAYVSLLAEEEVCAALCPAALLLLMARPRPRPPPPPPPPPPSLLLRGVASVEAVLLLAAESLITRQEAPLPTLLLRASLGEAVADAARDPGCDALSRRCLRRDFPPCEEGVPSAVLCCAAVRSIAKYGGRIREWRDSSGAPPRQGARGARKESEKKKRVHEETEKRVGARKRARGRRK